ncbi:MAG: hypothetical protein U1B80_09675 [Anaerolineaceae bacterium]|nr:hypothetical protein [Anaerolineaceae bacterium]
MSDLLDRVRGSQDIFTMILSKVPGFRGYIERESRRDADKLLRITIADRFEEQWKRISGIQRELISQGAIESAGSLEAPALKMRQFIDRVRTAAYGYAGFFDSIKINEEELARLYNHDLSLLESAAGIMNAVNNVEASIGTDGFAASVRYLTTTAQDCVESFNRRAETLNSVVAS